MTYSLRTKRWNIEDMTGYKPKTTFYEDFSIADVFGESAVKDTFRRAFKEWKGNAVYLTELVMVLNWKGWEYDERNESLSELYIELFEKAQDYAYEHLKGDDLRYFIDTTD